MKMWGGRFDGEPDAGFMQFSSSISFDVRLYPYDIECTRAWAEALAGASGIYQVHGDGRRELVVAGEGLIGLAFHPARGVAVASGDAVYLFPRW